MKPRKVQQRTNGTWQWDIRNYIGNVEGCFGVAPTEALAIAERDRRIANVGSTYKAEVDPLFSDLVEDFCELVGRETITKKQRDEKIKRAREFNNFETPVVGDNKLKTLGELRLSEITPALVFSPIQPQIFIPSRSHSTNTKRWTIFKMICNFALRMQYTKTSLYAGCEAPADPNKRAYKPLAVPSDLQVIALKNACENLHDKTLVLTAAHTGLRVGELFGLSWSNIHFEGKGKIDVRQALTSDDELGQVKTKAGYRTIQLSSQLREALLEWKQQQRFIDRTPNPHDLVFCSKNGSPHDRANFVKRVWNPIKKRAGVETQLRLLRHYFASKLFYSGQRSIEEITYVMGHESVAITQRHYAHMINDPDLDQSAVNKMDQVMGVL